MATRFFIGEQKDVALIFDDEPPESITAAMRAEQLPERVRWMTGSLIHRVEDGERVGHGILTRDPWPGEIRVHAAVIARSIEEAPGAVADGLEELEREQSPERSD